MSERQLFYSPLALQDLDDIFDYIANELEKRHRHGLDCTSQAIRELCSKRHANFAPSDTQTSLQAKRELRSKRSANFALSEA